MATWYGRAVKQVPVTHNNETLFIQPDANELPALFTAYVTRRSHKNRFQCKS